MPTIASPRSLRAELHHQRRVRGGGHAAGGEVHDRELAVFVHIAQQIDRHLKLLGSLEQLVVAQVLHAPAASAIFACSGVVTSIMTPPLSICARFLFSSYLFCSMVFVTPVPMISARLWPDTCAIVLQSAKSCKSKCSAEAGAFRSASPFFRSVREA